MSFDDLLEAVGSFGLYQKLVYALLCCPPIIGAFQTLANVYILASPKHRCQLPPWLWPNDTFAIQSEAHRSIVEAYIPFVNNKFSSCQMYANNRSSTNSSQKCLHGYVFDKTDFTNTFTTDFGLVCDNDFLIIFINQAFFGGVLIGTITGGMISDRFGRKPCLMLGVVVMCLSSIGAAFANSPILLLLLKFPIGYGDALLFHTGYVLSMEMVGPSRRLFIGLIIQYTFGASLMALAGIAWLIKQWQLTQLAISLPSLLFISFYWLVPESPRWLVTRGRYREAGDLLSKMAERNGEIWSPEMLTTMVENRVFYQSKLSSGSLWSVLKSPVLRPRLLNVCYLWFVVAMMYYGHSLNAGNLHGDIFVNSFLVALVEIPGYMLPQFTVDRFGRRRPHSYYLLACGLVSWAGVLTFTITENPTFNIYFSLVGKLFSTSCFTILFLWTTEMLPTPVRNVGLGLASMTGRFGTLIAPTLTKLDSLAPKTNVTLALFGALSVIGGISSLLLPETLGVNMPQTIHEGEYINEHLKRDESMSSVHESVPFLHSA